MTGWHFTRQTDIINKLEPSAFKIEMVANALKVNNGAEVRKVMNALVGKYYLKKAVVRVESHGDPSNRTRLFIVGMLSECINASVSAPTTTPSLPVSMVMPLMLVI